MRISKRKLFLFGFGIILLLVVGGAAFLIWGNSAKTTFHCRSFEGRFPGSDCGLYDLGTTDEFNYVIGKIEKKYVKNATYFVDFKTKNSQDKVITSTIEFPPKVQLMALTTLTPPQDIKVGMQMDPSQVLTPDVLWQKIETGDDYMILIQTLGPEKIARLKQKYGNLKYINCFDYNKYFVKYLKNSTLINSSQLFFKGLQTGCNIITIDIEKMK